MRGAVVTALILVAAGCAAKVDQPARSFSVEPPTTWSAAPASVEQATADAAALVPRLSEAGYGPEWFKGVFTGGANVKSYQEQLTGDVRQPLLILLGMVAFVLLIACSNVANLFLLRAESRTRETAIRIALGAGRAAIIRYVLVESLLLALSGGLLGVVLAWIGTEVLVSMAPAAIPRLSEIRITGSVLLFTLLVSVIASLLFGLLPDSASRRLSTRT